MLRCPSLRAVCSRISIPLVSSRSFIIPTKKTNVVNVYEHTPRKLAKGVTAIKAAESDLLKQYDPSGEKSKFISRNTAENVRPGDVVRISKRDGTTFIGMVLAIHRNKISSTITLRNKVHGTAVEMVYNVFNPDFTKLEIVRKVGKDKKKAKLYYLRGNVKYDVGDLDNEIRKSERRRK